MQTHGTYLFKNPQIIFEKTARGIDTVHYNKRTLQDVQTEMVLKLTQIEPNKVQNNPEIIDDLVRGLTSQKGQRWDNKFSEDIVNHLFESQDKVFEHIVLEFLQHFHDVVHLKIENSISQLTNC